jgi:hypothetical protein
VLEQAYALVVTHRDVLRWARCMFTGNRDTKSCIVDNFGGPSRLTVHMEDSFRSAGVRMCGGNSGNPFIAFANQWTGVVNICRPNDRWRSTSELARDGSSLECRNCAILQIATLLVHEAAHTCWRSLGLVHNSGNPRECDGALRIPTLFYFGVIARQPDAFTPFCVERAAFCGETSIPRGRC